MIRYSIIYPRNPKIPFSSHEITIELWTAVPVIFWELLKPYPICGFWLINSKDLFKTNNLSWDEADLDESKIVLYLSMESIKNSGKELYVKLTENIAKRI